MDRFGFLRRKAARADDAPDFFDAQCDHVLRAVGLGKQPWGHLVDPLVGALRAEQYGDQQGKGVLVIQWHGCFRI